MNKQVSDLTLPEVAVHGIYFFYAGLICWY